MPLVGGACCDVVSQGRRITASQCVTTTQLYFAKVS